LTGCCKKEIHDALRDWFEKYLAFGGGNTLHHPLHTWEVSPLEAIPGVD
jgi:hypothetical protein